MKVSLTPGRLALAGLAFLLAGLLLRSGWMASVGLALMGLALIVRSVVGLALMVRSYVLSRRRAAERRGSRQAWDYRPTVDRPGLYWRGRPVDYRPRRDDEPRGPRRR